MSDAGRKGMPGAGLKVPVDLPLDGGHLCCEHARAYFDDAAQAWAALEKFQRQILALANTTRGIERTINRRPAHGRAINVVVADGARGMVRGE